MADLTAFEVEQQYDHLAAAGRYAEALEIATRYMHLFPAYAQKIVLERTVIAGFSQGGGLALWLALNGDIPARGVIGVGPFLPNVEALRPLLEARRWRKLRVYLAACEHDAYCTDVVQQLAALLPSYGIPCTLDVYPDLGYSFPPVFEQRVPQALDFVIT